MVVQATVLKVDEKTLCMDFGLKKYKDADGEHDIISWEARDKFLRHFHDLTKVDAIMAFIDATLSQ